MSPETPQLHQSLHQEPSMLMGWRMNPLQMIGGIQVKDNMREVRNGKSRSMNASYKAFRESLMNDTTGVSVAVYTGRSNSGKSSDAQADYSMLHADKVLAEWQEETGRKVEVVTWPFALGMEATKTAKAIHEYPLYSIPEGTQHGSYTPQEYARHSGLQQEVIEQYVFSERPEDTTIALLIEASCPTAVPVIEGGELVSVRGEDRGVGYPYKLALDESTSDRMHWYVIERDDTVSDKGKQFRQDLAQELISDQEIFEGERAFSFVDPHEETWEQEKLARTLTSSARKKLRAFLRKTMAPPQAQERSDKKLDELKQEICKELDIATLSDREYFYYIRDQLGIPDEQFHVITNPHFDGDKDHNLGYFLHSLPVQVFPEILR